MADVKRTKERFRRGGPPGPGRPRKPPVEPVQPLPADALTQAWALLDRAIELQTETATLLQKMISDAK